MQTDHRSLSVGPQSRPSMATRTSGASGRTTEARPSTRRRRIERSSSGFGFVLYNANRPSASPSPHPFSSTLTRPLNLSHEPNDAMLDQERVVPGSSLCWICRPPHFIPSSLKGEGGSLSVASSDASLSRGVLLSRLVAHSSLASL